VTDKECWIENPAGGRRVLVTQELPGRLWFERLVEADCRVEMCLSTEPMTLDELVAMIGGRCGGVIGQLTEPWGAEAMGALASAGGRAYSNYAVGYNNVDLEAATGHGIAVGNTPGVLTETTAELAVALTFAAARRVVEAHGYLARGAYKGWLPTLFLGDLLWRKTAGVIGAGRIGAAFARMMVEGHKMHLVYFDPRGNEDLERYLADYGAFLERYGEQPVHCRRAESVEEVLREADVVSLHTALSDETVHLIDGPRLALMKPGAVLINASRGPIVDKAALVEHCRANHRFHAGLDVFEHEPELTPGLTDLPNIVAVPHIGSATSWTREGMATLAASNVAACLQGWPVWNRDDVTPFLGSASPQAAPSIVNAAELGLPLYGRPS
jgi:glycerate dehydrogenase